MNDEIKDLEFVRNWTKLLLEKAQDPSLNVKEAIGQCSQMCYQNNNMDDKLKDIHNVQEYVECLRSKFGWTVEFDEENDSLLCHENNTECLCPITRSCKNDISGSMCYCTEAELVRMTERATGRKSRATVLRSFIKDGASCVYRIELL